MFLVDSLGWMNTSTTGYWWFALCTAFIHCWRKWPAVTGYAPVVILYRNWFYHLDPWGLGSPHFDFQRPCLALCCLRLRPGGITEGIKTHHFWQFVGPSKQNRVYHGRSIRNQKTKQHCDCDYDSKVCLDMSTWPPNLTMIVLGSGWFRPEYWWLSTLEYS